MHMSSKGLIAALSVSFSFAAFAASIPDPGATWTIAAGEEQTVTESDMAAYNRLAKVVVNGTLVFSGVATAPAVVLEGSGTCRKTGDADWTLSTACAQYKGKWIFEGGTIDGTVATAFGYTSAANSDADAVYIRDGATLRLTTAHTSGYFFLYKWFHIAGTGKAGKGAIWVDVNATKGGYIGRIALDGAATINYPNDRQVNFQYGEICLNGYVLTFAGNGTTVSFADREKIIGPGEIVMDENMKFYFTVSDACFAESTPRAKITALGGNEIRFMQKSPTCCPWTPQFADLVVNGTFAIVHSHYNGTSTQVGRSEDLNLVWNGDISLPTASDLLIVASDATANNCMITLAGDISGLGSVQTFRSSSDGYSRIAYEGTNMFGGTMVNNLQNAGAVIFGNPSAVPDYSKCTVDGGRATLRLADDGSRWTTNAIADFVNAVTLAGNAVIGLDSTCAEGREAAFDAAFWKGVKGGSQPVLAADGGTTDLVGPLADKSYSLAAVDGTLRLTGDETIQIGECYSYSGLPGQTDALFLLDGASDVRLARTGNTYGRILLPGCPAFVKYNNMAANAIGRLKIVNSKLTAADPTDSHCCILVGSTYSGNSRPGIVEFGAGADVLAMVYAGNYANAAGAIYQTGGLVRNPGSNSSSMLGQLGSAGLAYQELSGGTYAQMGRTENASGEGAEFVLEQTGGLYVLTNHVADLGNSVISRTGNGRATYHISGGEFLSYGYLQFVMESGLGSTVFSIDGPDVKVWSEQYMAYGLKDMGGSFILNLNGGLLDVTSFSTYNAGTLCKGYLNAAGGTLKIRGNSAPTATRITLFKGGLTLEDNGSARLELTVPLEAPSGLGVTGVSVPDDLASKTLVGAPLIEITETGADGQGYGASAVAIFDRATGKVTGVKVTSHGCAYTEATATFHYADKTWTSVCSLGESDRSGGFTKKGGGQMYFTVPNTYEGPTVVEAGGLSAKCDWAFPSNTVLVLNGGNIGLGATACAFKSIGGTGGNVGSTGKRTFSVETLVPGTTDEVLFNNSTLAVSGDTAFDVSRVLAGETTTYGTSIAFGENATITIDNIALLDTEDADKASPITLMTVTSGKQISGIPAWTNRPADGQWKMKVTLTGVKLVKQRGMLMIVR